MPNPVTNSLKRAPRWAWYVVAGVGLGGAAITLYKKREARTAALADQVNTDNTSPDQSQVGLNPSPMPGVVVPPVILNGQQGDQNFGLNPLLDLFVGSIQQVTQGWQDVTHGWQEVYSPLIEQNSELLGLLEGSQTAAEQAIITIATAGPPPVAQQSPIIAGNPAPQTPAPQPPQQSTLPPCPPNFPNRNPGTNECYAQCGHDECHCEGTGANRNCWTRRDHGHCYPNGRRVHTDYEKIRNGC